MVYVIIIGDTSEKTLLLIFSLGVIILIAVLLIGHFVTELRTIGVILKSDLLPITGGVNKSYSGGILTLIYVMTVGLLVSGVVVSLVINVTCR